MIREEIVGRRGWAITTSEDAKCLGGKMQGTLGGVSMEVLRAKV